MDEGDAVARVVENADEEAAGRRLPGAKYPHRREGKDLSAWARMALPIAIELSATDTR